MTIIKADAAILFRAHQVAAGVNLAARYAGTVAEEDNVVGNTGIISDTGDETEQRTGRIPARCSWFRLDGKLRRRVVERLE